MRDRLPTRRFGLSVFVFLLLLIGFEQAAVAANGSVSYTYDALGRVSSISYDTGVFVSYSYDANGNRTAQIINVNSATGTWGGFNWGAALWH